MGLATSTVKHILLLLNFVFSLLGLIFIGLGIFIAVSAADNPADYGENVLAGLLIALGVVILIVSIFGCLAIIHESRKKILVYTCSVAMLLLLQLLMLSMSSQGTKDGLSGGIKEGFETLWEDEVKTPGALAFYEDWLQCCGVNGTEDYRRIEHELPKSCCNQHNCTVEVNIHQDGCLTKFEDYLFDKTLTFQIVGWILVVGEIAAVVLGWMLWASLKNRSRRANVGWM